jgi:hypothetical protein
VDLFLISKLAKAVSGEEKWPGGKSCALLIYFSSILFSS